MSDAVELGKLLHDTPELFPWICLAIILIVVASQRKRIFAYIDSRIDANKARKNQDAILSELIRNNTAALNNNTAALESVKLDRGETRRLLQYHENASKERTDHILTVVNRIDETVSQNERDITVIKEITKN